MFLYDEDRVSDMYVSLQALYKLIFSSFFINRTGLDQLDLKMLERGHINRKESMDFYEKYDYLGTTLFYLRNYAHIERLDQQALQLLQNVLDNPSNDELMGKAISTIESTYRTVLSVLPGKPKQRVELFPSIDGSGIFGGEDLILVLHSDPEYDEKGYLIDPVQDKKRMIECFSVAEQLEKLCSEAMAASVKVFTVV